MKYNLILIVAFAILLTLSSCSDKGPGCAPDRTEYFFIKPEERAVLPYKGFDTIKMKHSSGAIYTFVAGPLDSGFNITARSTSPDCPNNIFEHVERVGITFRAFSFPDSFELFLGKSYLSGGTNLRIKFKDNITFFSIPYSDFSNDTKYDFDSILIQGVEYFKVRVIYPYPNEPNNSNRLLYNKTHGILSVQYSNDDLFEKMP